MSDIHIPLHLQRAKRWKRRSWAYVVQFAVALIVACTTADAWHEGLLIGAAVGLAWAAGMMFNLARKQMHDEQVIAWNEESQETLQGMANAGFVKDPIEALEALRDGPPRPGFSRKQWEELHDEMIAEARKREDS